jgi:aminomethyltransferase
MDVLRIEAGLVFSGLEFDDQVDPFEAGIGFVVALRAKADVDFVGKAALQRRQAAPNNRLVGLVLEGSEGATHGDAIFAGRSRVGVVTSGTRSPLLRRTIALARVAAEHAGPGTALEVGKLDGHQKRLAARVVPIPFYDPTRSRVRS